ncbi:MAG: futalosine hydrolase [Desulfuromonadales bacterium]|jgi:futalosine hydrolase|nr:futalosine hydrolase [Desulfuromonadales bacterium]
MIAIVAAVPDETWMLRRRLFPCEVKRCGRRDLYCGRMFGHKVVVLHTGVGKINAASAVTALLESCEPDFVIVTGCCGAYPGQGLERGDLLLASEEICADEGVWTPDGFKDFATLGFSLLRSKGVGLANRFAVDGKLHDLANPILQHHVRQEGIRLGIGPLVTVSACSGTLQSGLALQKRTGGLGENMEGAAVAQVCETYGVPFLELRGVSNMVEDRNLDNWDLEGAGKMAQQALIALLRGWFSPILPA